MIELHPDYERLSNADLSVLLMQVSQELVQMPNEDFGVAVDAHAFALFSLVIERGQFDA